MDYSKLIPGDRIICITKTCIITGIEYILKDLTIGKIYTVIGSENINKLGFFVLIIDDSHIEWRYRVHYFRIHNETLCENMG